ncbi:hypothetical protein CR513_38761, partial [Mucuna pruriens]
MHVGEVADIVSQMKSAGSKTISSQMIMNPIGRGVGMTWLQSGKELPQPVVLHSIVVKRSEIDKDLLKLFRKVKINILLLYLIKQIPKYAKFLKELCVHKRKNMKGLLRREESYRHTKVGIQFILSKKCPDPGIFAVPCIIGGRTFTDAMLDLGA